ncbi:MAG: nucleoid-associated protein YejK [Alteromonadaceae bacterium]|nr:nucleoid-associated protein YejK [Alteromonadaceae bacterium]
MSVIIKNFIVHQLKLEEESLTVKTRPDIFDVNADIEMFVQQLNQVYNNKPVKGIGAFNEEEKEDSFDKALDAFLGGEYSFQHFSVETCKKLLASVTELGAVETGFVIISQFQFLATEYLMIAVLDTKEHVEINQNLELSVATHLDLSKMQLAARIDLTMLQTNKEQNRYVSFIKGRAGRKISDFFLDFLHCDEQVDIKQQNKQLIESVEEYLESERLEPEEKQASREKLVDYYKEQIDTGEEIKVSDVAEKLATHDQKQDFSAFNQSMEQPLEDEFQADKAAIKSLSKFSGAGGGVSISFDRKMLGDRIVYQEDSDTLIIKGIPPNLKDQLSRWQD